MSTLLELDRVAIHLGGREILSPTSFALKRGEFVCVIGPSGCGKTTLLRAASGFVKPSSGEVRRGAQVVQRPSREVAFVFQDYGRALLPWRTVQANVGLALEAADVPVPERASRIAKVLETVGLTAHADKFPAQLSGGMQQRASIARALASGAKIIIADEPTGNLDHVTGEQIIRLLFDLKTQDGASLLLVTHDRALAERCDRVAEVLDGRIVSGAEP